MSRGIKNNNPGNICHDGLKWRGETDRSDKSFKTFETMAWGVRAMFHLINNYRLKYGLNTVETIIKRWAPENENNTEIYIQTICKLSSVSRTNVINTIASDIMIPIINAMIIMKNGQSIPLVDIYSGWDLFIKYKL